MPFQSLMIYLALRRYTLMIWAADIYRVSQEERPKLREGVPCVKLYRYNPKHLCPKLNGYWDKVLILLTLPWNAYLCICQAGRQSASRVTSPLSIPVWCIVLRTLRITFIRMRGTLQLKLMALCYSQVTLMLSTDINITETTYSCQFQYEFGNQ